ncbi:pantoate--beta-alanine ligase [Arthrobacter castelli]|uniref:pantoate--beta-alanine ligase n=1 Tax=Arthrobacter castelli TaxID=271431 RepID=UPI0003F9AF7B|nr:pantoate--beta-alanine ligase [Arthrobacter castelli]
MTTPEPAVVTTRDQLAARSLPLLQRAAAGGRRLSVPSLPSLGLVPTMGALHEGHEALAAAAAAENDVVVATIFVNPLQFGDTADLERYPRTLDADVELLGRCGVDLVFAPPYEEVYPQGPPLVSISSGALGDKLEGASRPGHFDGALTVVAKLLHLCAPASTVHGPTAYRAYFGQKDAQQLALVRRMAADLNFDATIVGVPIVRSDDGLALSSRNRFLDTAERQAALTLSSALHTLSRQAAANEPLQVDEVADLVQAHPLVELDYLEVVNSHTLEPLGVNCRHTPFTGHALAMIAAKVGPVRLIDNMELSGGHDGATWEHGGATG